MQVHLTIEDFRDIGAHYVARDAGKKSPAEALEVLAKILRAGPVVTLGDPAVDNLEAILWRARRGGQAWNARRITLQAFALSPCFGAAASARGPCHCLKIFNGFGLVAPNCET